MNAMGYGLFVALAVSGASPSSPAQLDTLQSSCSEMYAKLQTVKGASLARREGSFSFLKHRLWNYRKSSAEHYYGCIMILTGNKLETSGDWHPDRLFAIAKDSELYQQGWRLDPNGTGHASYMTSTRPDSVDNRFWLKIDRGAVSCLINGFWGDFQGVTPDGLPSPLFEVDVSCGKKTG